MGKDSIIVILILIVAIIVLNHITLTDTNIDVKSTIDNNVYMVRDLSNKQDAANLLAVIKKRLFILLHYLDQNKTTKYKNYAKHIDLMKKRLPKSIIMESNANSVYTSYSVNKGESIVFCLRSRDSEQNLHDVNLLMYVALHELAHVSTIKYGHTETFKKVFAFLVRIAMFLNLYKKINFSHKTPVRYCGLDITESIV